MTIALWLPLIVNMCIWSQIYYVKPVDSGHFEGGLVYWRPVNPAAFDGRVQITHRIVLETDNCAHRHRYDTISSDSPLDCQRGCTGNIGGTTFNCTDAMDSFIIRTHRTYTWSAGDGTYTYNFGRTEAYFEISFSGNHWVSLVIGDEGNWIFRVRGNLTYREDTGLINSSPVVNIPSLIYLQHGCRYTIKIPVEDVDGDYIRCRWAENSLNECGAVCRSLPASLNENNCELQYEAYNQTGRYAIALQVEDFASPTDTLPLSSIPVQFVVAIVSSNQLCSNQPELVGLTPQDGSCIVVPFSSSYSSVITTEIPSNSSATSITDIITASTPGLNRSELLRTSNPRVWQMNITWSPSQSQFGPNIFCFAALDNTNLQSPYRCITLFAGGLNVGNEFCNRYAESSPPLVDATSWTSMTAVHNFTEGSGTGAEEDMISNISNNSIIITTICTILAFILGIICGLIAYRCVSALWGKRKTEQKEPSTVYDEVTPHNDSKPEIFNVQMELNDNVAYGQV